MLLVSVFSFDNQYVRLLVHKSALADTSGWPVTGRTLVANSAVPLPCASLVVAEGPGTVAEASPPAADAHERMANSEFATSVGSFDGQVSGAAPATTRSSLVVIGAGDGGPTSQSHSTCFELEPMPPRPQPRSRRKACCEDGPVPPATLSLGWRSMPMHHQPAPPRQGK